VSGLAYRWQAEQTVALIKELNPDQQAAILAASNAVRGLTDRGHRADVEALQASAKQLRERRAALRL
jgi:hypothetical protein